LTTPQADHISISPAEFDAARARVSAHAYHTPLLTSRLLSERSGFEVRLKAEMFQRGGSYKIRGPLNKLPQLTEEQKRRGVICSSAGNHAQGVAIAASVYGVRAVVVMAENATQSKVDATRAYGAEVVLHGSIWDEANAKMLELAERDGMTIVHPFDDLQLITGQGTLGLEIFEDYPQADIVVVPIGGGGLISGVATAMKGRNPKIRIIGVESSGAPGMKSSVEQGHVVTLDRVDCMIDGLRVRRVGENNFRIVRDYVDEIVTLPDDKIFESMLWVMSHAKLVLEGAAAAPVGAFAERVGEGAGGIESGVCVERRQRESGSVARAEVELSMLPLDGVRVIDFGRFIAGPYCGMLLADMGADVVRVDRRQGSEDRYTGPITSPANGAGEGGGFLSLNRNKRSITLDTSKPESREIINRLAKSADVVIANLPVAVMKKMGDRL